MNSKLILMALVLANLLMIVAGSPSRPLSGEELRSQLGKEVLSADEVAEKLKRCNEDLTKIGNTTVAKLISLDNIKIPLCRKIEECSTIRFDAREEDDEVVSRNIQRYSEDRYLKLYKLCNKRFRLQYESIKKDDKP